MQEHMQAHMRKWLRRCGWFAVGLVGVWLLMWLALPPIIKSQTEKALGEALGRKVLVGAVSVRPWSMELTLDDLVVAAATEGAAPTLAIKRFYANADWRSIFRLAPVLENLEIDAPRVNVARLSEGHYDIDDLIGRLSPHGEPAAPSEPARFALYNVQIRDGNITFDDRPVQRRHHIEALALTLPFLSNLPSHIEVKVEPRLAFQFNGTPFDSGVQATPFVRTRDAQMQLRIGDLDLAPYAPYLPASLPVRLLSGHFAGDIALHFALRDDGSPMMALKGSTQLRDLAVAEPDDKSPVLAWRLLNVALRDVQPLARRVELQQVRLEGAHVRLDRDAHGELNVLRLMKSAGPNQSAKPTAGASLPAPAEAATSATSTPTTSTPRKVSPASSPWQVVVDSLEFTEASIAWADATTQPRVNLRVDPLTLTVKQLRWPTVDPIPVQMSAQVRPADVGALASATMPTARLVLEAQANDKQAHASMQIDEVSLALLAPYVAQVFKPRVEGQLAASLQMDWAAGGSPDEGPAKLVFTVDKAALDALHVIESNGVGQRAAVAAAASPVSVKRIELNGSRIDVVAQQAKIGALRITQPSADLVRRRDGGVNMLQWLPESKVQTSPPNGDADKNPRVPAESGWRVSVADFLLDAGRLRWTDELFDKPVGLNLDGLRVAMQTLEWAGSKPTSPARVQLSARVGRGEEAVPSSVAASPTRASSTALRGRLDWRGQVGLTPLLARGTVNVEAFPVDLFASYLGPQMPVDLQRADAGFRGDVSITQATKGLTARLTGDALVADVRVASRVAPGGGVEADELLNWQTLALRGLKFNLVPDQRPALDIATVELKDFYSRLVINEQGRFNLRDTGPQAVAEAAATASAPAQTPSAAAPVVAAAASAPVSAPISALPLDITLGGTTLVNGRVDFTDRFVRPNYSADLTELNGKLGAFSSTTRDMATLELKGRAATTAQLEIRGALNPTASPLALDIQAKATDLELAPLSPYAGKYAGYAIERGKLTMDVTYKIDPDGKLDAKNQVILNQLTFGDKIDSPDATKLPVLLAVALLKDRNGVIDINLPISGSINDPQFSVFGLVLKVIGNLLVKALTAPFSLLAGGGSDELSFVEFLPGTAQPVAAADAVVDKVAKALSDRSSLKMTVTGAADLGSERAAMQRHALEQALQAAHRRERTRTGAASTEAPSSLTAEERNRLLRELYKSTDLPNKPRNAIGLQKDIPVPEMEAMLTARFPVNNDTARDLALQRGVAVRDALVAKGLPSERLFLAAPKLRGSGEDEATWTPRVQLSLAVN